MTVPYAPEIEELPDTAITAMVEAEAAAQEAVAERLLLLMTALWSSFSLYWEGQAVIDFATRAASLIGAAQRRAGGITEQYLRRQFQQLDVELPEIPIVNLPDDLRLGADTIQVYQRPIRKLRYLVAEEKYDEPGAAEVGLQRLLAQAETDLQVARRDAAQQVFYQAPEKVTGYRRIIHPELGQVCGLCVVAADRIYSKREMLPLHTRCKCTVSAITTSSDPGLTLNTADLNAIYAAAGRGKGQTTDSAKLKRVRVQYRENSELGTILMADGSEYKGPDKVKNQLSAAAAEQRRQSIQNQLNKLRSMDRPNEWYRDRIEQLEELAAVA